MLALGATIVVISAVFEILIVRELRPEKWRVRMMHSASWRKLICYVNRPLFSVGPWLEHSTLNSLIFSLSVSLAIGAMFPAAGVAVLIGGIGSTIATQPYYAGRRRFGSVVAWAERHRIRKAA